MGNHESCYDSFNRNLLFSDERNQVICLSSRQILIRYQLNENISPQITERKIFKGWINIRPMDENRFFIFSELESSVCILNWEDWDDIECYNLPYDEQYDAGNADAAFLPDWNLVICGGSWNKVLFLDLNCGEVSEAYQDYETNYVRVFSLSTDFKYISHIDQDQDSTFTISSIDGDRKQLKRLGGFDGHFREHIDSVAFSNIRKNEFGHVYMGRNPYVSVRRIENGELIEVYKNELHVFYQLPDRYLIKNSIIISEENSYLVATGKKVFKILFKNDKFETKEVLSYDEVINDMIRISGNRYILGTNSGVKEEFL